MRRFALALAFSAAALTGCATGPLPPPEPLSLAGLPSSVPMRLASPDAARADRLTLFGKESRLSFATGAAFARVFAGQGDDPVLTIVATHLEETIIAAGFAGRMTYTVDATVAGADGDVPVHAEGTQAFAISMVSGIEGAVSEALAALVPKATAAARGRTPLATSAAERLRTLEALRSTGAITQQEYDDKRAEILRSL